MRLVAGVSLNCVLTSLVSLSASEGAGGGVLGLSFWTFCARPECLCCDVFRLLAPAIRGFKLDTSDVPLPYTRKKGWASHRGKGSKDAVKFDVYYEVKRLRCQKMWRGQQDHPTVKYLATILIYQSCYVRYASLYLATPAQPHNATTGLTRVDPLAE